MAAAFGLSAAARGAWFTEKVPDDVCVKHTFLHCEDPDVNDDLDRRRRSSSLPPGLCVCPAFTSSGAPSCDDCDSNPGHGRRSLPEEASSVGTLVARATGFGMLDGRRLDSSHVRLCCTIRILDVDYVVSFRPKAVSKRRGGANFRASQGCGNVHVKCNSPVDQELKVSVSLGNARSLSAPTVHATHNFCVDPVCYFPAEIHLRDAIDKSDGTAALPIVLALERKDASGNRRLPSAQAQKESEPVSNCSGGGQLGALSPRHASAGSPAAGRQQGGAFAALASPAVTKQDMENYQIALAQVLCMPLVPIAWALPAGAVPVYRLVGGTLPAPSVG